MCRKSAVEPKREWIASVSNATPINDDSARRIAGREAYRAKIESLLGKSRNARLADIWQRVCPFPIDPRHELPDRRGMIADLADFAEALQPNLDGMKSHRLCQLVEHFATYTPHRAGRPYSLRVR